MKSTSLSCARAMASTIAMVVVLLLPGCAGPGEHPANSEVTAGAPAPAPPAMQEPAPTDTGASPIADRIVADAGSLNASCKIDADCEIKDVGSCCGFYPRCLNKGTQTFPEQVRAACGKEGRVSACGFPAITSCECVQGKCSGITISDDSQLVR